MTAEPRWMRSVRPGDRREHHLGRRDRELVAVVLADAEEVEPEPVGEHGLLDHVAQHLRVRQRRAVGADGHVAEGVESEFVALSHCPAPSPRLHAYACHSGTRVGPRLFPRPSAGMTRARSALPPMAAHDRASRTALPDDVDASIERVDENGGVDVTDRPVIGIFGAGKVGTALARLLVGIRITTCSSPAPRARPRSTCSSASSPPAPGSSQPDDLVAQADVIIVAVPFGKAGTVPWDATSTAASSSTP